MDSMDCIVCGEVYPRTSEYFAKDKRVSEASGERANDALPLK